MLLSWQYPFDSIKITVEPFPLNLAFSLERRNQPLRATYFETESNERIEHRPLQDRVLDDLAVGQEPRSRARTPGETPEGFPAG